MRGYFQHSTATPTGFRPWQFGLQGIGKLSRVGRMRGMGRLGRFGRLGDSTVGVPGGSLLAYSCQWVGNATTWTAASAIAAVTAFLQNWGISVISSSSPSFLSQATSTKAVPITLQIQTSADYGAIADVKSILDGAWYNAGTGSVLPGSSLGLLNTAVIPAAAGAAPNPQPPSVDFGTWLSDPNQGVIGGIPNGLLIAGVFGMFYVLPDVLSTVRKAL
jgi:hypothetical protein